MEVKKTKRVAAAWLAAAPSCPATPKASVTVAETCVATREQAADALGIYVPVDELLAWKKIGGR